ncbi:TonB family protein [Marinobacter sp.]|uniref:energy transducer TonB family protein n=1 Tax=Marinobacter sp. TaxID=50741 RepID=UPI0035657F35
MPQSEQDRASSIPVSYRIALALSLALMAHIILLAGFPSPLQEARELSQRLAFKLSSPPAQPSAASAPASESQADPRNPEFNVEPWPPQVVTKTPQAPANPEQPRQTESRAQKTPEIQQPRPEAAPRPTASDSEQSMPSEPTEHLATEKIQRITESPAERDPYLVKLAVHLAEELEKLRVPAMSELQGTAAMTLELKILPNGALTRARVKESTGINNIDQAAYRAALSASPYPKPEGEETDRFDVKLVFTPKRQ